MVVQHIHHSLQELLLSLPGKPDRLAGLVVKVSASEGEDPGFESRFLRHSSDL